ncbi:glycosyltransferase [Oscillibacter sp.]|uniref:glycosyltransferase family 2 protein n=1 Tax=Oscillibacter sp. TaxID=1945593 RepID=UPI00289D5F90|nr:glycosyltransferase [Oscillibacter sp.]
MPAISVIVPVYQAEKYIEACVESVRNQTFSDWELLLVDDGCTDGSPALCDRCAAGDGRIHVLHKEKNGGVSAARNLALAETKGDYIAFLDADDRYEPSCLETLWNLRLGADADSAACAHLNCLPDGTETPERVLPAGEYDGEGIRQGVVAPLLGDRLAQPVFNGFIWRFLFSREILRSKGITFEGAYLEDELFLMEYFCHAKRLAVTEQPLYRYYLNPASATHKYMPDFLRVFGRFMERKEELVGRNDLETLRPQWRENSNWAGLLIAIGNEYARGNPRSAREKQRAVEALCARPEMSRAIGALTPEGVSANKRLVVRLVKGRHFFTLTQLYRLKNRR